MGQSNTLTAFYEDREMADRAVQRLCDAGIPRDKIKLIEGDDTADSNVPDAGDKGFWESLSEFFFPSDDRQLYSEGLRRGGMLVTVTGVDAMMSDTALDILDDEGSVDVDERAETWRSERWSSAGIEDSVPASYDRAGDPKISPVEGVTSSSQGATWDEDETQEATATRDMTTGRSRARSYKFDKTVSGGTERPREEVEYDDDEESLDPSIQNPRVPRD